MEYKRSRLTESDTKFKTKSNKDRVIGMVKVVQDYSKDKDKKERKEKQECKYCFYINGARIGGSAITLANCRICDTQVTSGNTNIDELCNECAKNNELCKHCASEMD